jgi:hypothetical protein
MANLNFWNQEMWMGGGLTWNFYWSPIDARYNDIWVVPDPASNQSGNLEILRKWVVASPGLYEFWFQVRNNSSSSVYFDVNVINVEP